MTVLPLPATPTAVERGDARKYVCAGCGLPEGERHSEDCPILLAGPGILTTRMDTLVPAEDDLMTVVTLPASPEAVARGCTCPTTTNNGGHGIVNPDDGKHYWVVDGDCPLHGYGSPEPHGMEDGR